jgi:starch phosphorylase
LKSIWRDRLGITHDHLMSLGRVDTANHGEAFCMTVLALKNSRRSNAVSSLHGDVSRAIWRPLYPGRGEDEVPIDHITNGVHVPTWIAPQMRLLFDRHLGPDWIKNSSDPAIWDKIAGVDNGELWETHQLLKASLLDFVRARAGKQAAQRNEPAEVVKRLGRALSLDALTIGFARRFATYKRATTCRASECCRKLPASPAIRSSSARLSSSKTMTSTWPGTSCRESTSGSTIRAGRSRRRARAA